MRRFAASRRDPADLGRQNQPADNKRSRVLPELARTCRTGRQRGTSGNGVTFPVVKPREQREKLTLNGRSCPLGFSPRTDSFRKSLPHTSMAVSSYCRGELPGQSSLDAFVDRGHCVERASTSSVIWSTGQIGWPRRKSCFRQFGPM